MHMAHFSTSYSMNQIILFLWFGLEARWRFTSCICHMKFKSSHRTACRQTISENSCMSKKQPCIFSPNSDTAPLWNKWSRRSFTGSVLQNCTAKTLCLQQLSLWGQGQPHSPWEESDFEWVQPGFGKLQTFPTVQTLLFSVTGSHSHSQGRQLNKRQLSLWSQFYF